MRLLRTVITNYENEFKNELSEVLVNGFNDKQKRAFHFILGNADMEDAVLNKKLAQELYQCKPSYSSYKSFKDTFTKRILKIVNLKESRGSNLQKIEFELQEDISVINKLICMGFRQGAKELFNKTIRKALKYHNYEIARSLSLIIIRHNIFYGKEKEQKEAISKYEFINNICEQENTIKILYGELIKYKNLTDELKLRYKSILADVSQRLEYDSYLFYYYHFSIELILCDADQFEVKCHEAIAYFSNLWFDHIAYIAIFKNRLLQHKIAEGDYVKSKLIVTALMEDHKSFSYHWYLYALTYIEVLLYFGDNKEAYRWYHKIRDSRNYSTLPKDHRSKCEVLGMYVYLMIDDIDRISIRKVKYNLNYNHTERSNKHINFLIAEIIYHIKNGNTDIDKKVNHLQKVSKGKKRVTAFCNTLKTGKKYAPKEEASFENEIVQYERLLSLI